jgi:hypothetical protein
MDFAAVTFLLSGGLFAGMLALQELGRRLGRRRLERDREGARAGVAAAEGAVFALLGLLIAFSFSGAAGRFEERSKLITAEVNALGTAWLRLDLLPAEAQAGVRASFRRYVDARLAVYQALPDVEAALANLAQVSVCERELWRGVVGIDGRQDQGWDRLLLPALNEMFDIASERTQAALRHPPRIVFALLFVLALGCALLAGFAAAGAAERPLVHMLAFAAVISVTVQIVLDLEHPRVGLITLEASDKALIDFRASMQ